jgi:hypothetical protein
LTIISQYNARNELKRKDFVMCVHGHYVDNYKLAVNYTNEQLNKISAAFNKSNDLINKPIDATIRSMKHFENVNAKLKEHLNKNNINK